MKSILSIATAFLIALSMLGSAYLLSLQRYYDRVTPAAEIRLLKTKLEFERKANEAHRELILMHQAEMEWKSE